MNFKEMLKYFNRNPLPHTTPQDHRTKGGAGQDAPLGDEGGLERDWHKYMCMYISADPCQGVSKACVRVPPPSWILPPR